MLDTAIRTQLAAYLERLQRPIELIATLDTSAKSQEMRGLLDDIAALSSKVTVRFRNAGEKQLLLKFARFKVVE